MSERLEAAFNYVETLAIKYRALDYLDNKISLTKLQFHDLLNYFIDIKDDDMSFKLVQRFTELEELKNVKTRLKKE